MKHTITCTLLVVTALAAGAVAAQDTDDSLRDQREAERALAEEARRAADEDRRRADEERGQPRGAGPCAR